MTPQEVTAIGRSAVASAWRVLAGPPLQAQDVSRERITPVEVAIR